MFQEVKFATIGDVLSNFFYFTPIATNNRNKFLKFSSNNINCF